MSAPNEIQLLIILQMLNCLNLETFHTFLATKPLLPHILSYPPASLKELIFLIFTETGSLQVFTTENFQQLGCDIHRQWAWKNMGNSNFHFENVNIWPKTSQN